jgi:hypothetical protein
VIENGLTLRRLTIWMVGVTLSVEFWLIAALQVIAIRGAKAAAQETESVSSAGPARP